MTKKIDTVLIVDDDEVSNFIYTKTMAQVDFATNVVTKRSANDALQFLKNSSKVNPPDIVFLDINMPIMNGWEFLEEYRKFSRDNVKDVVLVMLSSSVFREDIEKSREYPEVNEYVSKPLTKETLEKIKNKYFRGSLSSC